MAIYIENTPSNIDALPTVLFDNLFTTGTLTVSSQVADYPKENLLGEGTTKYWSPSSLPGWAKVDLGSAKSVDCAAVVGHDLFTNGCTVTLQRSSNNSIWTDVISVTPDSNATLFLLFTSVSARFWRLYITGSDEPFVAVVLLGERLTFPAGIKAPYTPTWLCHSYELLTATTLGGQFQGNRVNRMGGKTNINLVSVERDFVEEQLLPFREHYNTGKAFIFAANPTDFKKDVGYVWRTENAVMSPTFDTNGSWMSASMEVYVYGE